MVLLSMWGFQADSYQSSNKEGDRRNLPPKSAPFRRRMVRTGSQGVTDQGSRPHSSIEID